MAYLHQNCHQLGLTSHQEKKGGGRKAGGGGGGSLHLTVVNPLSTCRGSNNCKRFRTAPELLDLLVRERESVCVCVCVCVFVSVS